MENVRQSIVTELRTFRIASQQLEEHDFLNVRNASIMMTQNVMLLL